MSNIGMMDSAFFVGRTELVSWINSWVYLLHFLPVSLLLFGHYTLFMLTHIHFYPVYLMTSFALPLLNSTLQVQIGRIEDTAFGGIACQMMDIIFPGQVAMQKVNWMAKTGKKTYMIHNISPSLFSLFRSIVSLPSRTWIREQLQSLTKLHDQKQRWEVCRRRPLSER